METTSRRTTLRDEAATVVALCAPTILGGTVAFVAGILRPDGQFPAQTAADQALVYFFALSAFVGALGIPFALLGLRVGARILRKAGHASRIGIVLLITFALALVTSVPLVRLALAELARFR